MVIIINNYNNKMGFYVRLNIGICLDEAIFIKSRAFIDCIRGSDIEDFEDIEESQKVEFYKCINFIKESKTDEILNRLEDFNFINILTKLYRFIKESIGIVNFLDIPEKFSNNFELRGIYCEGINENGKMSLFSGMTSLSGCYKPLQLVYRLNYDDQCEMYDLTNKINEIDMKTERDNSSFRDFCKYMGQGDDCTPHIMAFVEQE